MFGVIWYLQRNSGDCMKKSREIAYSGVVSALSVVMLFLGSVVWVLGYTMPLFASIIMIILLDSVSTKSALLCYISTSALSLLLLNDKECALIYALFFGFYPIVRDRINSVKPKILMIAVKYLYFNTAMIAAQLLCYYVFAIPFDDVLGKWGIVILIACLNLVFFIYDRLYTLLLRLYKLKLKKRIEKFIK